MTMPNYIDVNIEEQFYVGILYPFFSRPEFDKNANSIGVSTIVLHIDIVWRLSGFAFFVRDFGCALFYFRGYDMTLEINQRVKAERKKQGYTQRFIAQALGTKESTYSQMERSGNISAKTLIKIANILNVDIRYFLYGDKDYKPEQITKTNDYTVQEEGVIKILRNFNSKDRNDVLNYIENKYKAQK